MNMELVVAHYRENLNWLSFVDHPTTIYSKDKPAENSIVLPNVGRESHTYLCHIVNNYHKFQEWTVFTQGYPFDHSPDFLHKIHLNPANKQFMDQNLFLPLSSTYAHLTTKNYDDPFNVWRNKSLKETWAWLYPEIPVPDAIISVFGGLFVVNRKAIYNRPIEFYRELLTMHETNYILPWVMENLWAYIFVPYSNKSCKLLL